MPVDVAYIRRLLADAVLNKAAAGGGDVAHYVAYENRGAQDKLDITSSDNNNWVSSAGVAMPSIGNWVNFAGIFTSTTSRCVWLNGTFGSVETTSRNLGAVDAFSMGSYISVGGTHGDHADGDFADCALLSVAATADQRAAFNKGFSPRAIWPSSQIIDCWDLFGNTTNEPGRKGNALTPNGTPAKSDPPRVICPTAARTEVVAADPAGGAAGGRRALIGMGA